MADAREKILEKCLVKLRKMGIENPVCLNFCETTLEYHLDEELCAQHTEYACQRTVAGDSVVSKAMLPYAILDDKKWLEDVITSTIGRTLRRAVKDKESLEKKPDKLPHLDGVKSYAKDNFGKILYSGCVIILLSVAVTLNQLGFIPDVVFENIINTLFGKQ